MVQIWLTRTVIVAMVTVGTAIAVVATVAATYAATSLAGTKWTSIESACDIRELSFEADTAEIKLTWDVGGAHWKLKGQKVSFDLNDWDGKLEGTLASGDELDLTFEWHTTDFMPHFAKCGMARKK
jgi:hypothetical protein